MELLRREAGNVHCLTCGVGPGMGNVAEFAKGLGGVDGLGAVVQEREVVGVTAKGVRVLTADAHGNDSINNDRCR